MTATETETETETQRQTHGVHTGSRQIGPDRDQTNTKDDQAIAEDEEAASLPWSSAPSTPSVCSRGSSN